MSRLKAPACLLGKGRSAGRRDGSCEGLARRPLGAVGTGLLVFLATNLASDLVLAASTSGQSCQASTGSNPPAVVELFTSEGCSSCPPAERWLSGIKAGGDVVALAFHVNYWNHLGWKDPFATAATTERQYRIKAAIGSRYVYTPQTVLNGQDWTGWPGRDPATLPRIASKDVPAVTLSRDGGQVTAEVSASRAGGGIAGYWAVLEDGLVSRVKAGENAGSVLTHDHVVSHYQPVDPWDAASGRRLWLDLPDSTRSQRVAFVVTDTRLVRPMQALVLACR